MAPFELVYLIVTGDLIQQGVTHQGFSLTGATLAIFTFAAWSFVLGRRLLESRPRAGPRWAPAARRSRRGEKAGPDPDPRYGDEAGAA